MQSRFANVKMRNYEASSVFEVHIHSSLHIMSASVIVKVYTRVYLFVYTEPAEYELFANKNKWDLYGCNVLFSG